MLLRFFIMILLCVVIFGGVFGLRWFNAQQTEAFFANMPPRPATISAGEPQEQVWRQTLEAIGSLVAVQGINVTTEVAGVVASLGFESGDSVKAGAVLLKLDARTDQADLKIRQAELKQAEVTLERATRAYKTNGVSQADFDGARSLHAQATARMNAQQARVAQKIIRAPFAGKLGIRQVDLGQYLAPGTAIVSLTQRSPLFVDFSLPEQHLNAVQVGQAVGISVDLFAERQFTATVVAIDTAVDLKTRNFRVRAELPNDDGLLRPGVYARASLQLAEDRKVLAVPRTAINYNPYGNAVFVVVEEPGEGDAPAKLMAKQRFIRTGAGRGDFVSIVEGLEPGERVVTSGLLKLRNGQPVVINNEVVPEASLNPAPKGG